MGRLRVSGEGTTITRFRTHKTAALLGFLAYHSGRPHPREALAELLWTDDDPDDAKRKLTVALSSLRQQLEPPGTPDGLVLQRDRTMVQLNPSSISLDCREFEKLIDLTDRQECDPHRVPHLNQAVDIYCGPLLPGFYEDWIASEQRRLECRYLSVLHRLVLLCETKRPDAAAQYCLRSLAVDPIQEEMHRHLMHAYARLGQTVLAQRQYRELERLLRVELGRAPAKETLALYNIIERGEIHTIPFLEPQDSRRGSSSAESRTSVEPNCIDDARYPDTTGGAIPLDSEFYVTRAADSRFTQGIQSGESILLLKGPSQVGKTSLLARGIQFARDSGARVAHTDLQLINSDQMVSANRFLMALARYVCDQLDSSIVPSKVWTDDDGPNQNFRRFIRTVLNEDPLRHLVWGIDDVDRLRSYSFGTEVFALFRSWHNERVFDPKGPWSKLTLCMAYSSEANLLIDDPNQSPFNVGTRVELDDFTRDQIEELNRRYGIPLSTLGEIERVIELLGGHPFLIRRVLQEFRINGVDVLRLEKRADQDDWVFGDHLRRMRTAIARKPLLEEALRRMIRENELPESDQFYQLRSAGFLKGEIPSEARFRCKLYHRYLAPRLMQ